MAEQTTAQAQGAAGEQTTTTSGAQTGAQTTTTAATAAAGQDAKGQTQTTTETKDSGKAEATTAGPVELALKLPDGVDAAFIKESFEPLAKELGLKSEGAQKLVDLYQRSQTLFGERVQQAAKQQNEAWVAELKGDKEIGGANYEASHALAQKTIQRFGGDALVKYLGDLGVASHPELVRAFVRIGKAISEDTIGGGTAQVAATSEEDLAKRWFPNTNFNAKE
jgi:hypothetical protein